MEPTSSADEVAAPVRRIELSDLKTLSGNPFSVVCERVPEEQLVAIIRTLPGEGPAPADANTRDDDVEFRKKEARVNLWLSWAPSIIPLGTCLVMADGRQVRPAFYFGETPSPGAVPGKFLSARDRTLIMNTILSLSGWTKEAAAAATFHDGERGERSAGAGAVGAQQGVGEDSVGSGA